MGKKIDLGNKKDQRPKIWKPVLGFFFLSFFIIWMNDDYLGFNDRGVYIAAFLYSFVLVICSYLILCLLTGHRILKKIVLMLTIFVGVPLVGYFSDTSTFFRPNLLTDAMIYNGSMPEPEFIMIPNGEMVAWFSGQANLFTDPKTNPEKVENLVASLGGKVLTRIPTFGYYLIEVTENIETAIKIVGDADFILEAEPNMVIVGAGDSLVDLTDTDSVMIKENENFIDLTDANTAPEKLTAALLKSPDPDAGIIVVQIDIFKDRHGYMVNNVREAMGNKGPVLQIDVGSVKCGESYCSSADRIYAALSSVLAGAQMNRQKVAVNISLAVMPLTQNPEIFDKENGPGSNSWATTQWESFAKGLLHIIESSEWSKKGNVIISQSAGNGACLTDKGGSVLDCAGINMSDLMVLNMLEENQVNFYGAEKNGQPAKYSSYGSNVIMKEIPENSEGTSVAAAQAWAETEKVWQANRFSDAKKIKTLLTKAVCPYGLQVCYNSCIPTNAECCNHNVYCLKPGGSCELRKPGTCSICPPGKKFCGMFCVDVAQECQKEIAEQELPSTDQETKVIPPAETKTAPKQTAPKQETKKAPTTSQTNTNTQAVQPKGLECNGKQWSPCPSDQEFYCPPSGDATCVPLNRELCNGKYWSPCQNGERFYCPDSGDPSCMPVDSELCNGTFWQSCPPGSHFVCIREGGTCEPDKASPSVEPDAGGCDQNACTRKYNACRDTCYRSMEDCLYTSCATQYADCVNVCDTQYTACLNCNN